MAQTKLRVFIFDPNCHTILTTDASDVGLGCVLSQVQNGKEMPIAFASHTLQQRERNYATNEREALACVWGCEHLEKFLLGRPVKLRTDHAALTTLLNRSGKGRQSSKFERWFERLSMFDYHAEYTKGTQNKVADWLSRLQLKVESFHIDTPPTAITNKKISLDGISLQDIKNATLKDNTLQQVSKYVSTTWPPKKQVQATLRPYLHISLQLNLEDGYLTRDDDRIVVPSTLQRRLLQLAHAAHPGIVRMKRKMRETYWWPGMDRDIENLV